MFEGKKQFGLAAMTPGINFDNIFTAAFAQLFLCQKVTKPNCN